jgi:long-chain-fatty-acid--CoA ligase ACSBG
MTSKQPEKIAMLVERGGKILKWTWKDYENDAISFAKSLTFLGINERKCVNVTAFNSPEWCISFIGSLIANCVISGVYITNTPEACVYQAEHSEAEVIVVDTLE